MTGRTSTQPGEAAEAIGLSRRTVILAYKGWEAECRHSWSVLLGLERRADRWQKFMELQAQMSPESQTRAEAEAQAMLAEMRSTNCVKRTAEAEAVLGGWMPAKQRARDFTRFSTMRMIIFPIAGKSDLTTVNPTFLELARPD